MFTKLPWLMTIVVGLSVVAPIGLAEEVAPGVTYTDYTIGGPRRVFVVATERTRSEYELTVGFPQQRRNFSGRAPVSTIAAGYDNPPECDVIAAVNASFFGSGNDIVGAAASEGEMLEYPVWGTETFFIGPEHLPFIVEDVTHVSGVLTFDDGSSTTLHDYNQDRTADRIVAYTPQWSTTTGTTQQGVEIVLTDVSYPMRGDKELVGTVASIKSGGDSSNNAIPSDGMVLSSTGSLVSLLTSKVNNGDRLRMTFDASTGLYNNADMSIGGIGWLVKDGVANTSNWPQHDGNGFASNRHPRTALGWNDDYLYLVVVDGRSAQSIGMNFSELAGFLTGTLQCDGAINLDGGGSSTMLVNGTVRNNPSDGNERAVANAVMLVRKPRPLRINFSDPFAATGRRPEWEDKFTYNDVVAFSPVSPGGDGQVMTVADPSGGSETIRAGSISDSNYQVSADIYCEYRPGVAGGGFERYGLFARDNGTGSFGLGAGSAFGAANCYALLYNSDTGRIQAGRYVGGVFTDFLTTPVYQPSSAWRRFSINCQGSTIEYSVDGTPLIAITDSSFERGYYGVGYREEFPNNANIHGSRVDNLVVIPDPTNHPPVANLQANPTGGDAPLIVQFDATGSSDPDGDPLEYEWDFGDDQFGTGSTVQHTYDFPDTYAATLTVWDDRGGADASTATIEVTGVAPEVIIESRSGGQNHHWYAEQGTWGDAGQTSGAVGLTTGIGSRYGSTFRSVAGLKSATFTPDFAPGGTYTVYGTWPASSSARSPILYRIAHAGGITDVDVDQTLNVDSWVNLGTYDFDGGTNGSVRISNEHINESGSMYASAVKFVRVTPGVDPPVMTEHPQGATHCPGEPVTLAVVATGEPPLSYQWQRDGENLIDDGRIGGSTAETLSLSSVMGGDAGSYQCVVSNGGGSITSDAAIISVLAATQITQQPQDDEVLEGADASFSVQAQGEGTLLYEWRKDDQPLSDGAGVSGSATATLSVSGVDAGDLGDYACSVSAGCGSVLSESAELGFVPVPGDFDGDRDVDLVDFSHLQVCLSGFTVPQDDPDCQNAKLDGDADIDFDDVGVFLACITGPNIQGDPDCDVD